MATLEQSREQQAAQRGLVALMLQDLAGTWTELDPGRLGRTLPRWVTAVRAVVGRYGDAAGALGLDYYEAERDVAGVPGRAPSPEIRTPNQAQVEASLRWATKRLWDDRVLEPDPEFDRLWRQILGEEAAADLAALDEEDLADIGDDLLDKPAEPAEHELSPAADRLAKTRTKVDGIASRLVTDVGRGAVIDSVSEDRQATGWVRIASASACAFCRMLAQRGPVYSEDTARFQAHDHCKCIAAPIFEGDSWEPEQHVLRWRSQYQQAARMKGDTLANLRRIVTQET